MEYDKNPLTPHLQIYKWQISSLLSITHRITGVVNAIAISLIFIWFLLTINNEKILFENILNSFFGKFLIELKTHQRIHLFQVYLKLTK